MTVYINLRENVSRDTECTLDGNNCFGHNCNDGHDCHDGHDGRDDHECSGWTRLS